MHLFLLLIAMAGSQFLTAAALEQQQQQDRCATNSNKFQCHYNTECIWCEKQGSHGRCMNWTGRPEAGETCDALVGCGGHRTQTLCDKDAKCKWCTEFTQGWPFCANITEDTHLAATCDKPTLAHPMAAQDVSQPQQPQDRCAMNSNKYQCHYDIECIWCDKQGSQGRCMNWTGRPQVGETCDALVGCGGHRTQTLCDKDAKCKWCTGITQGWPFCANITEDTHLAATCNKPTPAHPTAAQDVSHPQQPQDRCAMNSNMYQCHYDIECIWCDKQGSQGRCMNWTGRPQVGETCDALVGCGGHRTQTLCDTDAKCKWCTEFTQGWPFCANITEDTHLAATCDKPTPVHPTAAQDISHPQQPQDRCAMNSNMYQCHYNIECIWCEKQGSQGRCMNWTGRPRVGETCDALVGCGGHRTQTLCDTDANCKWCTEFTQGWPFCANITEDAHLAATCDKPTPAHPMAAQDVPHPLAAAAQEPTILELIVENKAHSFGKSLYIARGSSSCWGIPGLAPQMDGSYNLVPDETNTVCPCRKGSSCDYASSIILGFNFDYSWDVLHKFEKQAAEVRWIGHGNRTKDGSIVWTYSCGTLSGSNPSWKVACRERPSKHYYAKLGYTVTIEDAVATSDYSSSLFLM